MNAFLIRPISAACMALAMTATLAAHAASDAPANTPTNAPTNTVDDTSAVPDIVVSGSREGSARKHTPAAIDVIGSQRINDVKPTFIGELLNQAAGVYMPDLRNEQHMMSIRQPISTNAFYLYLEDGLPIRPPGLFNHNALYELNMEGVDRVEVLRGPASSLYGSNAVGGAVNFLSRSALAQPQTYVGTQASDQGYRRVDFGFGTGAIGEPDSEQGLSISGYAARKRGGEDSFNDAAKESITLRHDKVFNARTSLKTTLTSNHLDTDMPGGLTPDQFYSNPGFSNQTFTYRQVHTTRLTSTLEGQWNDGGLTSLTAFARDSTTDQLPSYRISNTSATTAKGYITNQSFTSLGMEARHRQDLSVAGQAIRWVNGLLIDQSPMQAFDQNLAIQRNAQGQYISYTLGTASRDYTVDVNNQALYSQAEWAATPQTTVVAGIRHDRIGYDYTNRLTPSNSTGAPSETRQYQHTSPKLGATWRPTSTLTVFGNLSQSFTPPEVSAQYGSTAVAPTLRPSTFDNIDSGVRWLDRAQKWSGELALYQLSGKDEILSYTIAPGVSESRNAGRTQHRGIEFALQKGVGDVSLGVSGAYARHTYEDYKVSSTLDYSGKEIKSAPRWLANAEARWQVNDQWQLAAIVQHVDRYWMNDADTVRYNGHDLLNLQARWQHQAWELWAKLSNATNKRYAEQASSSYNGTGAYTPATMDSYTAGQPRTFLLGVRYHFGAAGSTSSEAR